MTLDPRRHNQTFAPESIKTYLDDYVTNLQQALKQVDQTTLEKVLQLLQTVTHTSKRIYVCGNGGSAAIADHLCCDLSKGTHFSHLPSLKTHSLVANTALLTACANDYGFEKGFSYQIEMFGEKGDALIAISSSGNSENILNAVKIAKQKGLMTIGLSGFTGGQLKDIADLSLHVNFSNYGLVEDSHQILMHVFAQYFTLQREKKS
jgi:D-sedoheptulose 7-phosphate isomerase